MATVNLLNNDWQTSTTTSAIQVDATSARVKFRMGTTANTSGYAKACIKIDPSTYGSITFQYSARTVEGISDLWFGIWDDMTASSSSGEIKIHSSAETKWNNSGGSITFNIPNSTGYKYVGFRFYGNETTSSTVGVTERVAITSLTATERGYTLTYNANGGSGVPSSVSNVTSATISSTIPTRTGYDFLGWSTSSYATSVSYVAGNSISLSSNVTLYAVWRAKAYTLSLNGNGGSFPSGSSYTVTYNSGNYCSFAGWNIPTRSGYTFNGLYTAASGGTKIYNSDGSCVNDGTYWQNSVWVYAGDCTLYAQWTANTYTVTYNANGGSGVMDSTTHIYDAEKVLADNAFTRVGYAFIGWNIKADGSGDFYGNNQSVKNLTSTNGGTIILYAQWEVQGLVYIYDSGKFSPYQVLIYDGSDWNQYVPYIYTESGWEMYSG